MKDMGICNEKLVVGRASQNETACLQHLLRGTTYYILLSAAGLETERKKNSLRAQKKRSQKKKPN